MVDNYPVKPAKILDIKGLVKAKLGPAGGKLIRAHGRVPAIRPAFVFAEDLLDHDLVNDVTWGKFHQAENCEA
jgi:hypothetical protein